MPADSANEIVKFTISVPRESCTNAKAKYSSSVVPPDPSVHFYHWGATGAIAPLRQPEKYIHRKVKINPERQEILSNSVHVVRIVCRIAIMYSVCSSVYFTFSTIAMSLHLSHDLHLRLLRVVQ